MLLFRGKGYKSGSITLFRYFALTIISFLALIRVFLKSTKISKLKATNYNSKADLIYSLVLVKGRPY